MQTPLGALLYGFQRCCFAPGLVCKKSKCVRCHLISLIENSYNWGMGAQTREHRHRYTDIFIYNCCCGWSSLTNELGGSSWCHIYKFRFAGLRIQNPRGWGLANCSSKSIFKCRLHLKMQLKLRLIGQSIFFHKAGGGNLWACMSHIYELSCNSSWRNHFD